MNTKKLKNLIKEEIYGILNEDPRYTFNFKGQKFGVRFDVNHNPTKKGVKIQFYPLSEKISFTPEQKIELNTQLQVIINQKLSPLQLTVDYDPDVPYRDVIGYTLKLGTLSEMITNVLNSPKPKTPPPQLPKNEI